MRDRVLDVLNPLGRIALRVLSEVKWNNLVLEHGVDSSRIELVLHALVGIGAMSSQCPSRALAIALVPPSVEHREVEQAIHLGLLATGSRCLEWACGSIEPDVNTSDKTLRHCHVVVLKEYNLAQELRHLRNLNNALNQVFTGTVGRMRFTCKDKLNREFLIIDNAREAVKVGK